VSRGFEGSMPADFRFGSTLSTCTTQWWDAEEDLHHGNGFRPRLVSFLLLLVPCIPQRAFVRVHQEGPLGGSNPRHLIYRGSPPLKNLYRAWSSFTLTLSTLIHCVGHPSSNPSPPSNPGIPIPGIDGLATRSSGGAPSACMACIFSHTNSRHAALSSL